MIPATRLRTVFMGTPSFAVPSLRVLAERHDVVAVYTRPDAISGRGARTTPSPVKTVAAELGIALQQPHSLRDPGVFEDLALLGPDVIVVAAFGMILPREILELPPLGCINVHASLLPRWRGAAPVQRAILAGDRVTGVSIMRMEEGLDTGPYCRTATLELDELPAAEATDRLAVIGAEALDAALAALATGGCNWTEQDDSLATYAPKIEKSDVALGPDLTVEEARRRVRASTRQAPSRLLIGDIPLTVLAAQSSPEVIEPGAVAVSKRELAVGLADGALALHRVRPEGRGDMSGPDWARGARIGDAASWSRL